jgi:hypothetical protein
VQEGQICQRERRAGLRRIDYYASPEADRIIDALRWNGPDGDASSIINRALVEWAASQRRHRKIGTGRP